ncbi:MAG: hypothetical protein C4527_27565 [Candidatus Omnitrophota bacterium]|nr:MAG: hypothetical protein C4527_27565 [Candidatus Omnitrophota bacterium]
MTDLDKLFFWGIMILLCIVCLVSVKDIWSIMKTTYRRALKAWKWHPYLSYLGVGIGRKKQHMNPDMNGEEGTYHGRGKKIFPRSRRST